MPRRRRFALLLALVALVALAAPVASRYLRAGRLLYALSGANDRAAAEVVEKDLVIEGREGPIRARLYRRADTAEGPGLVVAHGVHWKGIDERRLVPFARELARAGRALS